ncbi:MAG TPA: hypothetical protein VIJ33_01945 [Solirubrobacteraceae bacterium]
MDGLNDSGGHLRASHRALLIRKRRIVEDASHRSSADSQLLQMVDCCAFAALQSLQNKPSTDERFRRQYETALARIIMRPLNTEGRCIRGYDYPADQTDCPSERAAATDAA